MKFYFIFNRNRYVISNTDLILSENNIDRIYRDFSAFYKKLMIYTSF